MSWTIERIINYPEDRPWGQGYFHYGFHDRQGHRYFFHYFDHCIGRLGKDTVDYLFPAAAMPRYSGLIQRTAPLHCFLMPVHWVSRTSAVRYMTNKEIFGLAKSPGLGSGD
jgi:hypothetical protein